MPFEDPEENNEETITLPVASSGTLTSEDEQNTGTTQYQQTGPSIGQRIMQLGRQQWFPPQGSQAPDSQGKPWQQGSGNVEEFFGGRPRFMPQKTAGDAGSGETNDRATSGGANSAFTVDRQTLPPFRPGFRQATVDSQPEQDNPIPLRKSSGDFDDLRTLSEESSRSALPRITGSERPREIAGDMRGMASVTVPHAQQGNVSRYFPLILDSLRSQSFRDLGYPDLLAYSLATIHAENGGFEPTSEQPNSSNTTPGGHPFDIYENPAHRRSLGNTQAGDGEKFKGRGFIQLTGRANYADMGRKLGLDLVGDPDLASDPQVAAKIFAQYMKDHEFRQGRRPGLSETVGNNPDAQEALQLYIDSLKDVNDAHPEVQQQLANHNVVQARVAVNGANANGLPNGLENYLPAFHFGRQYLKLMRTGAQNSDLTVQGAADIWTEGDPLGYRQSYLSDLKKQLGTNLDTKVSALNAQQRQELDRAQQNYVRRVENEIDRLRREKNRAQRRGRAQ